MASNILGIQVCRVVGLQLFLGGVGAVLWGSRQT